MTEQTTRESAHGRLPSGRNVMKATRRLNEFDIVLTQEEASQFLIRSAAEYEMSLCTRPDCPVCQDFVWTWASVYRNLKDEVQFVVDQAMERSWISRPSLEREV